MNKKAEKITIDDLGLMVAKGFQEVNDKMDKGFKEVVKRFDSLENVVIADHRKRIERLEKDVKELKELLAV